jgi:hypothetical protein
MWLYVGIFAAKNLFDPVDGELFGLINYLTAAVISSAGIAFGIFIRHNIPHGHHYGIGGEIFRGDQLNPVTLTFQFLTNEVEYYLVHGRKGK